MTESAILRLGNAFLAIYFATYDVVRRLPIKSWIPGVSVEFSRRVSGILFMTMLLLWILGSLYVNFVGRLDILDDKIIFLFVFALMSLGNYVILRLAGRYESKSNIRILGISAYAVLLCLAFLDWSKPF